MENIRRHDIDWIRVIAIGLLLIYHIAIAFQPWGLLIGFIQSNEPLSVLWTPMAMLNVWRIPLLFFVSGMGVFFAMKKRNWLELIKERTVRILVPFIFGFLVIVPLHVFIILDYYNQPLSYQVNMGHLWFLGNIFVYVLILSPLFFYLKKNNEGRLSKGIKKVFGSPIGLVVMLFLFTLEVFLVEPNPFEKYAETWHGFYYGFLAFLFGYLSVYSGENFWKMILKGRFIFLLIGLTLYLLRVFGFNFNSPWYLLPLESLSWIISVFAFGHKYSNKPSQTLTYLSQAAYPVYIVHMFALYGTVYLIFPTELPIWIQFILVVLITFVVCFGLYELLIRRVWFLRPLFGLRPNREKKVEKLST